MPLFDIMASLAVTEIKLASSHYIFQDILSKAIASINIGINFLYIIMDFDIHHSLKIAYSITLTI